MKLRYEWIRNKIPSTVLQAEKEVPQKLNPLSSHTVTINRSLVGMIAAAMLAGAGILWFVSGNQNMWTGACLKVGLVMGAVWLALPVISRHGNWGQASWGAVIGTIGAVLVLAKSRVDFKIILPMLVGVGIAVAILRPRSKTRPK